MRKFKNIVRKSMYQRIMDEVYSPLYKYDWVDVPDMENVSVSRCDKKWVSEIVSERLVQRMRGNTPLFISSQTGSGKTTFIFENCIPVAEKEGKKVLYLCNRTALKNQIKKEAMKNPWNNSTYVDGIKVAEYKEYYTEKGLSKEHKFGLIDIYAYQEMLNFSQNKVDEYAVVVMDEAHFFLADAKFNPFTELILDIVTSIFKHTRRIYLSATPQESFGVIYETEKYCHKRTTRGSGKVLKYRIAEKEPKTENSYRTLRVPGVILEQVQERKKEVEEQKKKLGKDYIDRNYVSCSDNGLPHSTSAFNNALTKLCKRNGFPHLTVHSLRHMYASILLEQGVPLVKISALLGHSSIHTTFEFYCETMNDEDSIRDFMNMKFVPGGEA